MNIAKLRTLAVSLTALAVAACAPNGDPPPTPVVVIVTVEVTPAAKVPAVTSAGLTSTPVALAAASSITQTDDVNGVPLQSPGATSTDDTPSLDENTPDEMDVPIQTPDPSQPTETPEPIASPVPVAVATDTPEALSCRIASRWQLSQTQLADLGCPISRPVDSRTVATQRFERGFMVIFDDDSNSSFQTPNQKRKFFALADDGRAWRTYFDPENTLQTTSPNADDWYTCNAQAGRKPQESGVPWRGFGMVWCTYSDISVALGSVVVSPDNYEALGYAAFQDYERGRVFMILQLNNGFVQSNRVFVVHLGRRVDAPSKIIQGAWN